MLFACVIYNCNVLWCCFRSDIFSLFDQLLLLSQGHTVYLGDPTEIVPYFTNAGYPCPELSNPGDFYGRSNQLSYSRFCKNNNSLFLPSSLLEDELSCLSFISEKL